MSKTRVRLLGAVTQLYGHASSHRTPVETAERRNASCLPMVFYVVSSSTGRRETTGSELLPTPTHLRLRRVTGAPDAAPRAPSQQMKRGRGQWMENSINLAGPPPILQRKYSRREQPHHGGTASSFGAATRRRRPWNGSEAPRHQPRAAPVNDDCVSRKGLSVA